MILVVWPMAIAAIIALFLSNTAFVVLASSSVAIVLFTVFKLKRLPRVRFSGLSPDAEELLRRYNHAWVAPGATRITSSAAGAWIAVFIGAGIYFLVQANYSLFFFALIGYVLMSISAGATNPVPYITKEDKSSEAEEIAIAYADQFRVRRSNAVEVSQPRIDPPAGYLEQDSMEAVKEREAPDDLAAAIALANIEADRRAAESKATVHIEHDKTQALPEVSPVRCGACNHRFDLPTNLSGQLFTCPACGHRNWH